MKLINIIVKSNLKYLRNLATKILEFLSEIEAGETAIEYINFTFINALEHANNKPRKLTGLLNNLLH